MCHGGSSTLHIVSINQKNKKRQFAYQVSYTEQSSVIFLAFIQKVKFFGIGFVKGTKPQVNIIRRI